MTLFAHENDFNAAFLSAAVANKIPVSVLKGFRRAGIRLQRAGVPAREK